VEKYNQAQNFLKVVCVPAGKELSIWAQDSIREWKVKNIISVIEKAEEIAALNNTVTGTIHPKVALSIIDNCSVEEEEEIQKLWAGLFASSIQDKPNDQNLMFSALLKQLTFDEVKIIKYMCENSTISFEYRGIIAWPRTKSVHLDEFKGIIDSVDLYYIESLLFHLSSLILCQITWVSSDLGKEIFRFNKEKNYYVTQLTPTAFCLSLYLKCIGFKGTLKDYYFKS
jgi:hypothetical protein